MIRWCAYCQSYLGEKAPFDNFDLTHTICPSCKISAKSNKYNGSKAEKNITKMEMLIETYRKYALKGCENELSFSEFINESLNFGGKPYDLFFLTVQPILKEIGELFEKGQITVTTEHRFSKFAEDILSRLDNSTLQLNSPTDILLVCVDQNYHSIGVKALALATRERGYKTTVITPSLPNAEIISVVERTNTKVVGISIGTDSHFQATIDLIESLRVSTPGVKICIGGNGIKDTNAEIPADFIFDPTNQESFFDFLSEIISQRAA